MIKKNVLTVQIQKFDITSNSQEIENLMWSHTFYDFD